MRRAALLPCPYICRYTPYGVTLGRDPVQQLPHSLKREENLDISVNQLDEIWNDDILDRRKDADYIHFYLTERYKSGKAENGFVLAINAEWGVGKTFMLERWRNQALAKRYPAIYFDAWKNDFSKSPLLAFISDLEKNLTDYFKHVPILEQTRRKTMSVLKTLWKPALTILVAAGAKHLAGLSLSQASALFNSDGDAIEPLSEEAEHKRLKDDLKAVQAKLQDAIKATLDGHKTTQAAIEIFKQNLSLLIHHLESTNEIQLPLLIFVDELDRCRPDYAIELLEGIKHLFGVPGVYFVVGANLTQLGESVKAIYGSGFDGQRYLKRFFDLQYSLSEPTNERFARFVLKEITIPPANQLITGLERYDVILTTGNGRPSGEDIFCFILAKHADAFELTLRDQRQIVAVLEAALFSMPNQKIHLFFLVFLAVVYHADPAIFRKIERTGSVNAETGFSSIYQNSERGLVSIPFYSNQGKRSQHNFSVLDIANVYLSSLKITNQNSPYAEEFPKNVLNDVEWERKGTNYLANYGKYFNVIQSAGGFSASAN